MSQTRQDNRARFLSSVAACAAFVLAASLLVNAQSTKGGQQQQLSAPQSSSSYLGQQQALQSPGTQIRQQQQYSTPATRPAAPAGGQQATKRRPTSTAPQVQQQRVSGDNYVSGEQSTQATTEDPLADSEPALYGSVAGQPGVDFPAYTRIPKTSFTCEGKGFDFGFYADEEAGCQVYHVCWSGRRESFLCGVGTVFNQAILACDYWHSVDCSKSSQFYGVNSELGKASGEPAANTGLQRARPVAASLPASGISQQQSSQSSGNNNYGEPISQRRVQQSPAQILQQQQQQTPSFGQNNDDFYTQQSVAPTSLPANRQQQQSYSNNNNNQFGQPTQQQRIQSATTNQFQPTTTINYGQERVAAADLPAPSSKTNFRQPIITSTPASTTTTVASNRAGTKIATQQANRNRASSYNMDLSQKVNSLIESPVRPPIGKSAPAAKTANRPSSVVSPPPSTRRPIQTQQQQPATNFARLAVAKAQQQGSQTLSSGRTKSSFVKPQQQVQQTPSYNTQQQQQQEQSQFDSELDEPQQQNTNINNFDDSPVQTSTISAGGSSYSSPSSQQNAGSRLSNGNNNNNFVPQQQLVIQSGGGPDGSSAITTQYDTLNSVGQQPQQQQQQQQQPDDNLPQQQIQPAQNTQGGNDGYESALTDSNDPANDDFRSSGARAAASHNRNWYIMRSI